MRNVAFASFVLGASLLACESDHGPTKTTADASDAPHEAGVDAPVCVDPSGGNDISFDLECAGDGYCAVSTHLDFHVPAGSAEFPGCGDGQGNLEFANLKTSEPLSGTLGATLELDVLRYTGFPGKFTLEPGLGNSDLLFDLEVSAGCEDDASPPTSLGLLIQDQMDIPDSEAAPEGGPTGVASCEVVVASDCTRADHTHDVKGTLSCTFPDVMGRACTITNGQFQLGGCAP